MAAIINKDFRLRATKSFIADVKDNSNSYYLFIGRPDTWPNSDTAVTPTNTDEEIRNARNKMMALQTITDADITHAIPRVDWISGTTYSPYTNDQELSGLSNYYVITDEFNVYICLRQGKDATGAALPSTSKPTSTTDDSHLDDTRPDGYIWKYLFSVTAVDSLKFLSAGFIPVTVLEGVIDPGSIYYSQYLVQLNAEDGALHSVDIVDGGSGITTINSVTVEGDGNGCTIATSDVLVVGGEVVEVKIDPANIGSGYTNATIKIDTDGTDPIVKPVFAPPGGFGKDPREELRAHYSAIHTLLDQAGDNDKLPVDNDYRQIGLIRNPTNYGTSTISTGTTLNTLKTLQVSGTVSATRDDVLEGATGNSRIIFVSDYQDTNGDHFLKYIQDDRTGYGTFTVGEALEKVGSISTIDASLDIDVSPTNLSITVEALVDPDINKDSGEIVFLENRSSIDRSSAQTERVKLVLEF